MNKSEIALFIDAIKFSIGMSLLYMFFYVYNVGFQYEPVDYVIRFLMFFIGFVLFYYLLRLIVIWLD